MTVGASGGATEAAAAEVASAGDDASVAVRAASAGAAAVDLAYIAAHSAAVRVCVLTGAAADDTGVLAVNTVTVTIVATVINVTVAAVVAVIAVVAIIAIAASSVAIAIAAVGVAVAAHNGVGGVGEYAGLPHRSGGRGREPLRPTEEVPIRVGLRRAVFACD